MEKGKDGGGMMKTGGTQLRQGPGVPVLLSLLTLGTSAKLQ